MLYCMVAYKKLAGQDSAIWEVLMNNQKNNLLVQLLKLFGMFIISWLLIVAVFATIISSGDEIPAKYNGLMAFLAIILAFAVTIIVDFNAVSRLKSLIEKTKTDIESVNETATTLIDKAERVADKYRSDETDVYKEFAHSRKEPKRVRNSKDFKAVMEAYPELQANIHTQKLLSQIEMTEKTKLDAKMNYSSAVAQYNSKIHTFPVAILRRICKWEDIVIEAGISKEELVSDEELGI